MTKSPAAGSHRYGSDLTEVSYRKKTLGPWAVGLWTVDKLHAAQIAFSLMANGHSHRSLGQRPRTQAATIRLAEGLIHRESLGHS